MVVAEIFLTAFITVLFEKLASVDLIQLARSEGIYSHLNKWNKTLSQIQAVLADAGQKQIRERAVQLWLHDLQNLAYDIDDLLDDLATEAMRRQLNEESYASTSTGNGKVLKIIPTCCTNFTPHTIMYGGQMSSKLDEITTKLHSLVDEKNILGLNVNVERSDRTSRRSEETSLVDESIIVGREGDKEALLGILLVNEAYNQNVSIVCIVGLGGIGKTTLAQVLYNEEKVKDHFELMSWVCVSEEFDVFNISKAIYKDVGGDDKKFENLNQLHEALKEKLSKKMFLFVLDDVWNENYKEWELLRRPFLVGASGSKIIVTTRKTKVTSVMDSVQAYPLEVLSNEAALSLFAQHALGEQNFDKHPRLKLHGEGIVYKCGRLPLALMTLGRVLRKRENDEEWKELLNNEIWNLPNESQILPALRLSYYDLPSHLKQLFAYCCLFPKDYIFDKDELVLLWMAEGFLQESNANKSMESFGREYFEELKSRSFFQHLANDESRYTMHGLINDLATSVAGEFFFRLDDKMDNEASEKLHHFSFIRQHYGVYRKFRALQRATRLRTFLSISLSNRIGSWGSFFLSNKVLVELLPQLRFIRVLSLTDYSIKEVPQSIGCFKHMRYLNFSRTDITYLPNEVSDLYNLQSLLVCGCNELESLPDSFVKLKNLRHLDISDTRLLNKIPLGIGRLMSLQTLSKVIIEEANGFKISELKGLVHLQGQLYIKGLHNVRNGIEAKEANLQQKKGLDDLEMEWTNDFDVSRNEMNEYEVLEGLMPHSNLRNLKICFYGGTKFPSWVGNISFFWLTHFTLHGCRSCTYLPTLGHLSSLRKLFVESMNGVNTIGSELLGPTNSCLGIAFPSLEVLEFKDMQGWEKWSTSGTVGSFPCLREISIVNCPKLAEVNIDLIPSLRILYIGGCSEEVLRSMVGVSSSIVRLTMWDIKGLTQLHGEVLKQLEALEDLHITWCNELRYLWESDSEACKFLVSLRKLEVKFCKKLVSSGEKEVDSRVSMESIREVIFHGCERLERYICPNSIERMKILKCPLMTLLTFPELQDVPSTLKFLSIDKCENLEESWLLNNFLSSLEILIIWSCANLNSRSFSEGRFVHLTTLQIWNCDNIESIPDEGFGFIPLFCLRYLRIYKCKNLKSFPHEHLQSLTSLEDMWIHDCPSMAYSFPCGSWPPNLRSLRIGCLKKPMSEWGQQNYPTSLVELYLYGGKNSGVVSFAKPEDVRNSNNTTSSTFLLPPSLTSLEIKGFMDVESRSTRETASFTFISKCEKLPKTGEKMS
ncbi:hypothetical protein L6452_30356 [Arctium lappa]|uniref:Uncharacterized protein n=1 Tax=Arctium lappa TaxID=4217 RepID=A0ACB8ZID6_ARCLA|nr:hypothetical protein L6452_30356 [Arctium lappa]